MNLSCKCRPIFPEATKFGGRVAKDVESLAASAVDGALEAGTRFIAEGIDGKRLGHFGFDEGTAAQTPGGAGDGHDKGLFEGSDGSEIGTKGGTDALVFFVLAGADKIAQGEQTVGYGVLRRGLPALVRTGTGREKCVLAIGQRLSLSCHLDILPLRRYSADRREQEGRAGNNLNWLEK